MKNRDQLIEAICQAYDKVWCGDKDYFPKEGMTYCNCAVCDVANTFGCNELNDMLANDMFDIMKGSPNWVAVPMEQVQDLANQGSLVLAVAKGDPHGHICVIRPGIAKYSAKWGVYVPVCMNVGKDCFIGKGINWAFKDPPSFYVWKQSL